MPYAAPVSEESSATEMLADKRWESLSFASTLYLRPILDALLAPTPDLFHDELRLGLQEALVNAAKHGNRLDPQKKVSVRYAKADGYYWWIVSDQGDGFEEPLSCPCPTADYSSVSECGRGLYILHQVFDQVRWINDGKEVCLAKQVQPSVVSSLISPAFFLKMIESWWRRWSVTAARSV
ncbi:MAG: ATP-binding protein [Cyanobacteria bacterium J06621_11]